MCRKLVLLPSPPDLATAANADSQSSSLKAISCQYRWLGRSNRPSLLLPHFASHEQADQFPSKRIQSGTYTHLTYTPIKHVCILQQEAVAASGWGLAGPLGLHSRCVRVCLA